MCDVEKHIEQWRADLVASDALAPADVLELESHLREEIEHLKNSGLSGDEAFVIARHRLGDVSVLEAEFAKAHPYRRLSHQVYWMIMGILGYLLVTPVSRLASSVSGLFGYVVGLRSAWLILITSTARVTTFAIMVVLTLRYLAHHPDAPSRKVSTSMGAGAIIAFAIVGLWWIVSLTYPALYRMMSREGSADVMFAWYWAGFGWEMLMPFLLATAMVVLSIRRKPTVQNQL